MGMGRHLDGDTGLIDAPVTSIAIPSASVALRVGIQRRLGLGSLCGGSGGRDEEKEQQKNRPPINGGLSSLERALDP